MHGRGRKINGRNCCLVLIFIAGACFLSGCAFFEGIVHFNYSRDHFLTFKKDDRIRYESGAEAFAAAIASVLPSAVAKVESRQFAPFPDKIRIYACRSPASFHKLTGRNVSALTYRKSIFLSPRLLDHPDSVKRYVTHELSHLHLYQHIGDYAYLGVPSWFAEGLAAFVSDGGGAEKVSEAEAKAYIASGKHFQPFENAGLRDLMVPRYASYWGIKHQFKHHMFYRQCQMFVAFLEQESPARFEDLVRDLEKGLDFSDAFRASFSASPMSKWNEFKKQLK